MAYGSSSSSLARPGTGSETNLMRGRSLRPTFEVGTLVVIRGLQNHIELNGTRGRVLQCYEMAHRYEVRAVDTGHLFRVKAENLVLAEEEQNEQPTNQTALAIEPR